MFGKYVTENELNELYTFGQAIGSGTFAEVKFAMREESNQPVAVKIIKKSLIQEYDITKYVQSEIEVMRKLPRHVHIIELIDVLETRDKLFMVMEYASGGVLFEKMQNSEKSKFEEEQARYYFQQLILGLHHCHKHKVSHRDLKPENLLLENDVVKITDFGFSSIKEANQKFQTILGTPQFLAPEILVSDSGYDGPKVDVWACGIILYSMIAGYVPFPGDNPVAILKAHTRKPLQFNDSFSNGAKSLIIRMLQKDPAKRISMDQILKDKWFAKGIEKTQKIVDHNMDLTKSNYEAARGSILMKGTAMLNDSDDEDDKGSSAEDEKKSGKKAADSSASAGKSNSDAKSPVRPAASKSDRVRKMTKKVSTLNMEDDFDGIGGRDGAEVAQYLVGFAIRLLSMGTPLEEIKNEAKFERFVQATLELQKVKLEELERKAMIAFFINLFNTMMIHAIIVGGPPKTKTERRAFFSNTKYRVGKLKFSLDDIHHGILRGNKSRPFVTLRKPQLASGDPRAKFVIQPADPRVHFALCLMTESGVPLRVYSAQNIDRELNIATCEFLKETISVNAKKREIRLPKVFDNTHYKKDFSPNETREEYIPFIQKFIALEFGEGAEIEDLNKALAKGLDKVKIRYDRYSWEFQLKPWREFAGRED